MMLGEHSPRPALYGEIFTGYIDRDPFSMAFRKKEFYKVRARKYKAK
jgi:hypothetical protein